MIAPETFDQIDNIKKRAAHLWKFLDGEQKLREIEALEAQMGAATFWDNNERAQRHIGKVNGLKRAVLPVAAFRKRIDDLDALKELIDVGSPDEQAEFGAELTTQAGAGGTESNDWADMMFRMYSRWAERRGYETELMDVQPGDTAGISKATLLIKGENAYGYCKAERGVHRLVRISPFDSNARRHTSFCAVDVVAEVTDEIKMDIPETEVRIDVYRSSGKGGQGVNTTDSAVRITHLPSGIVVVCQNERSQLKNKASAWSILKARLYEKKQDEQRAEMDRFYGEKGEIGWGAQIRSYVLQPYQMVKDLRTGIATSDTQGVMDGDLDRFITAWLRAGCPRHRNKDIQMDE